VVFHRHPVIALSLPLAVAASQAGRYSLFQPNHHSVIHVPLGGMATPRSSGIALARFSLCGGGPDSANGSSHAPR
jgi:hypothetical protein